MNAAPRLRIKKVHKVKITCDACGFVERFDASSAEELESRITEYGWHRYDPTGTDICWRCKAAGFKPRITIQVMGLPE